MAIDLNVESVLSQSLQGLVSLVSCRTLSVLFCSVHGLACCSRYYLGNMGRRGKAGRSGDAKVSPPAVRHVCGDECPPLHEVRRGLYLGSAVGANDVGALAALGIRSILSVGGGTGDAAGEV